MKTPAFFFGILLMVIFGGGFMIRFFRDGDFYIAVFTVGVAGILLTAISLYLAKKQSHIEN
ncbi:hypothetical protein D3H55_05055 [Bacillus salacetis]|uniref:Uncharacterized protein n=1 Tax=Bacillus salacetis TaxID=2315464 RepID=A0A3A1R3U0_9BACI|nr:hypothetical protein [Bacillus salacetis]RIW37405.1 hypothetical protein D3H55_05055 [Bacillus salacetis]